ncbi:MAG: indolepyruvate oxidoreductase subunit beta family protein [Aquabacterium sp.]
MSATGTGVQPLKIAILAMGGEGGGVLADWIAALGLANGHLAQTTSVPGVAQRTGATIYYVELFPRAAVQASGRAPVLALMPLPGDVDIVLASELMEAGRAVQRGLVTPDRTTFIASTHRVYSMTEKTAPGDGRVDAAALLAHARAAARRFIGFDMAETARADGSVIGAVLFGALAGAGVLPFDRRAFEATIESGGVGVQASLRAFATAYRRAQAPDGDDAARPLADAAGSAATSTSKDTPAAFTLPEPEQPALCALVERLRPLPTAAQPLALEGLRRLVDYQDIAHAAQYLDRLESLRAALPSDEQAGASAVLAAVARHLALWMSYEDTVRVADLKTRGSRFARVQREVGVAADAPHAVTEFLHPRLEEIADTLPAGMGRWLLGSGWPRRLVERACARGRHVTTNSLRGYLLLSTVAGLRRWRRGSLRYATEDVRIRAWLADIDAAARAGRLPLAQEIAGCQRLVKGYGDTHARGWRHFETLQAQWRRGRVDAAALARLREAALADDSGDQLRHALAALDAAARPPAAAAA